ncbi:hypothetical protein AVEN_266122-1 [Araneus ventricosus]|uniref:Uncharacterized protein n=1 Tax=Araneus ventricosus TaxID=182803 RepID=A0A4Y2GAG9_ARAVE|nr:hypothetical protein AVEN_266122-1 [Araneus ventricosus]
MNQFLINRKCLLLIQLRETTLNISSKRANSKTAVASKAASTQKFRGHKGVKEISKSVKKASISSVTKCTVGKTSKSPISGAKKVDETKASRYKGLIRKKADANKGKKPRKTSKETGLKRPNAKPSAKASISSRDSKV